MSFTSATFLIVFFPICILFAFLSKKEYRNLFLCLASAVFYSWCGIRFLIIIFASSTLAYASGRLIERAKTKAGKRTILTIALVYNIGLLFFYKYLFELFPAFSGIWNSLTGQDVETAVSPLLPLGISFYTFSVLSYILDVFWEKCSAQKNILNIWLYVLFFPKVVQGPIMRYHDFEYQTNDREISISNLNHGFERFIKGMFKKVMIADRIAPLVDYSFSNITKVGTIPAWIGAVAYLIQLYYDFSGYSDMAVGLGLMTGFDLPENFDHPYVSKSVGEFWRRWHASLGTWFKDYVYTPVFRFFEYKRSVEKAKNPILICDILALFCVWVLTGIWHGSGVKFFVWGMWYFSFIVFERIRDYSRKKRRKNNKSKGMKKHYRIHIIFDRLLTLVAFVFGQVIFRAKDLKGAARYIKRMLVWDKRDGILFLNQFDNYMIFAMIVGITFCFPVYGRICDRIFNRNMATTAIYRIILLVMAFVTFCYAMSAGYSAFLYEVF